jgi:Polysaccharide biosynthesis protein
VPGPQEFALRRQFSSPCRLLNDVSPAAGSEGLWVSRNGDRSCGSLESVSGFRAVGSFSPARHGNRRTDINPFLDQSIGRWLLMMATLALAPVVGAFYHEPRLLAVTSVLAIGFFFNGAGVQHSALLQRQMRFVFLAFIDGGGVSYVCQTTQVQYETPLAWWDIRQYVEDYTSGNISLWQLFSGTVYSMYFNLSQAGVGLGPAMRWFFNNARPLWRGIHWPRTTGSIPDGQPTPTVTLNLQPVNSFGSTPTRKFSGRLTPPAGTVAYGGTRNWPLIPEGLTE